MTPQLKKTSSMKIFNTGLNGIQYPSLIAGKDIRSYKEICKWLFTYFTNYLALKLGISSQYNCCECGVSYSYFRPAISDDSEQYY